MNLRTSPPLERELRPYDIPDLMLPALLSWWGPDSRLRHFGDGDEEREDYEALWSLTERLGQVKPKGLSKGEMEVIPAFRYSAASKDSSNGSCVVCMMNYSNKEKLRRLPCNHDFHAKCIDRWLKNNRSCPVCRKDVTTK
ncbi:E3 ubiquitin-protein ligase RNF38-like [Dendronephthya gigantea]|nr:E3 ubiquitin-protein ligase RNF38-like [Dendronephthya gigantea]